MYVTLSLRGSTFLESNVHCLNKEGRSHKIPVWTRHKEKNEKPATALKSSNSVF